MDLVMRTEKSVKLEGDIYTNFSSGAWNNFQRYGKKI